jgi:O-antigen ligase
VALGVGAAGAAAAVAVLEARPDLSNAVGDAPAEQGPRAALLIGVTCLATGGAHALACRLAPAPRLPRAVGWVTVVAVVALVVAAVAAADPAERFEAFKRTPAETTLPRQGFVTAHLLSGAGSGRWQFWTAARDEFREHPLQGGGAGSYEAWWAQHGSFSYFIRDAHSLYVETLAELGAVGLALLVAAFGVGLVVAIGSLRRASDVHRSTLAALTAAFAAYALGAGIDWMWELTVVSVVGFASLGLLAFATSGHGGPRLSRRYPVAAGAATLAAAWVIICLETLPLLTQLQIERSQAAVRRGDAADAIAAADTARRLEPWAATPYTQLALVHEQTGQLDDARRWIDEALERNPSDWRNWLIAARVQTKAGDVDDGRRSLTRAIELNPRSPLFRTRR